MNGQAPMQKIRDYERVVEERPGSAVAHYNLALAWTRRGRVQRAEKEYLRALELDPDMVEAWVNLGGVRLLQWNFPAAVEALEEATRRRPDLAVAHYNLGQAWLYLGDAEKVIACNRKVIELQPANGAAHYFLAVGLLATGEVEEARRELSRAMAHGHRPSPEFLRKLEQEEMKARRGHGEQEGIAVEFILPGKETRDDQRD